MYRGHRDQSLKIVRDLRKTCKNDNPRHIEGLGLYNRLFHTASAEADRYITPPMKPLKFLKYGLNKKMIWPAILPHYEALTSGNYVESVLTGGIGTAKTTLAVLVQAYETYRILNLKHPHREFGLDPDSEIVIIFQSITAGLARSVDYDFFRNMIDQSPWFQKNKDKGAGYDPDLKSIIKFDKGLTVRPVAGLETAAIGQNVIGGVIDEINFLQVVEQSKKSVDGNAYDQAQANYNAIARRRESRFMTQGYLAGMLCLISSKRYPGQFTDRKEEEAILQRERTGSSRIYVYDKRTWEVRPEGSYGDERFMVFKGDRNRKPFVIPEEDEEAWDADDPMIDLIPMEYLDTFEADIYGAMRDIAGVSTAYENTYIPNVEHIAGAFGRVKPIFNCQITDFIRPKLHIETQDFNDPEMPRAAHIDLASTSDSAGLAVAHIRRFVPLELSKGVVEMWPEIVVDGILELPPPAGSEIDFAMIRLILYRLRELGCKLQWITLDSWQSTDTIQELRKEKFTAGVFSLDKTTRGYDITKRAMAEGRLLMSSHETAEREFRELLFDPQKTKIDHPPSGSKDCSDAIAGAVRLISTRKQIWKKYGLGRKIPKMLEVDDSMNDG